MPTLYVENIPDELYRGLRQRALANRSSIAAEVIALLESNIPTAKEMKRGEEFYRRMEKVRSTRPRNGESIPTMEEMVRAERAR
jgi:plasmid stability protein